MARREIAGPFLFSSWDDTSSRASPLTFLQLSKAVSRIALSRITNLYPYERAILNRAHDALILYHTLGCEVKDLLRCSFRATCHPGSLR